MNSQQELYDIYGVMHVPWWQTTGFYYALVACAFFAVVILVVLIVRYARRKKSIIDNDPLKQLAQCERLINEVQSKEFYHKLLYIVKNNLGTSYCFSADDKTDVQIIVCLEQSNAPMNIQEQVRLIFETSYLARFADIHVSQECMKQDLQRSRDLITHLLTRSSSEKENQKQ